MKQLFLFPLRLVYFLYAAILFIGLMVLIIPFLAIAFFVGEEKGGNFIYKLCSLWADSWLFLVGIKVKCSYQHPFDGTQQCIFVCNHQSNLDIPMAVKVIRQPVRFLGKHELGKVPVFRLLYKKVVVMVDRSSAVNRAKSVEVLKNVLQRGMSIVVFPEGTFNTSSHVLKPFYDGAFRIAIETQTSLQPIVFLDTKKRYHYNSKINLNPGVSRAIFLKPIPVERYNIEDVSTLKAQVYKAMETALLAAINK
jgi:1-acyl-sn-glycerol-3-phosphate acyltransferase